jgi:CRISPR-associated endonuclease Csn1
MKKILGLDLGTNSIGWAVVNRFDEITEKNGPREQIEHYELRHKGVVIFSEGVKIEKGNESSKAAERTGYRSARRIKFRRKLRKYETLKVLIEHGMCPLGMDELNQWRASINEETGGQSNFKKYPSSITFLHWLLTDNEGDKEQRKEKKKNPYYLRNKALDAKLTKEELGRVMYHFAQRRGFLSNRLDSEDTSILEGLMPAIQKLIDGASDVTELNVDLQKLYDEYDLTEEENKDLRKLKGSFDGIIKNNASEIPFRELKQRLSARLNRKENLGAVKQGISDLSEKIAAEKCRTMGEYFHRCLMEGRKVRKQYTAREEHYLQEFKAICEAQSVSPELREKLERAIFYQRPLKSQKGTVGKCSLEPSKARCPVSHPDFEEFRMYAFLNNVKIKRVGVDEQLRDLNDAERSKAIEKFYRKVQNFKFEDIAKALSGKGERYAFYKAEGAQQAHVQFNFQMDATVSGCPISASLKDVLGDNWHTASISYKTTDGNGNTVNRTVDYHDLWHVLFTFDSFERIHRFATVNLRLTDRQASSFARTRLKKDYASLSLKAIRNILPYLQGRLIYSHAVFMANLHTIIDEDKWAGNEEYLKGEIRELIQVDRRDNMHIGIVNDLMHAFKVQYANQHRNYELDDTDRADVRKKVNEVYGVKAFAEKSEESQNAIIKDIETRYLACLRSGSFIQKKRLDEKVIDLITDNHLCSDPKRLNRLYHPSDIDAYPQQGRAEDGHIYLGSPMTSSVRNPMAMRALHQLRKLVNTLIKEGKIDEDTIIHIELARELNDANKRKAIQAWQKKLEAERAADSKEIIRLFQEKTGHSITPNADDLLKFKLWREQNGICIYTGQQIAITAFIGPNPLFEIEHTLPRSISEDNSDMNLTLCEMRYNREVKKNRIPFEIKDDHESFLPRIEHWKTRYEDLERQMEQISKKVKGASTKEAKDSLIEKRHLIRLEYEYFKGKYDRFTMKEVRSGFKNSQKVDIGIISKLSRAYLSSVFPRVLSVKGSMVAEFRKAWGLQDFEKDEKGQLKLDEVHGLPIALPKDRSNHAHHCQDAVTIACMSKLKYDMLAQAWGLEEKGDVRSARKILEKTKPWVTFTEDVRNIPNEVLIYHHTPDHVGKKAKIKWRKRGKVQRNDKGEVIYLQGGAARGSLHKDTFYGAILRESLDKKTGEVLTHADGSPRTEIRYVVRKELASVDDANLKNIVDDRVRAIVIKARETEKELQKQISELKKQRQKADESEEKQIDAQISALQHQIADQLYVIPPRPGKSTFTPIKKVRLFQPTVTDPIHLKPHTHPSRHGHKADYHVMNDGNYMVIIYEGENRQKLTRDFEIHTMLDAANGRDIEVSKNGLPIRCTLTKGALVLFYQNSRAELKGLPTSSLNRRLYQLVKFDKSGRLYFRPHTEARPATELQEQSRFDFDLPIEQYVVTRNGWDFIVAGQEFSLSVSGTVKFNY